MSNKNPTPPPALPLINALPATTPFIGPEALERQSGQIFKARIGANESSFGPSPKVIETIQNYGHDIWHYGDPENYDLIHALARHHCLAPKAINVGAGVDALLGLAVRLYIENDDVVINSLGGYPTFNYHVNAYGGRLVHVPYKDFKSDLNALAQAAHDHHAKIVYLANPDNPLGTWHTANAIEDFIRSVPSSTMIILDEAYGECAPEAALPPIDRLWPNVLRMRTFSKAYALAGMRCGYVIGPAEIISLFDKIRDHFAIGLLTQKAAIAALDDQTYLEQSIQKIIDGRHRIQQIALAHDLEPLDSAANFVAIDCGHDATFARFILDDLAQQGVFIRKPSVPVLDRLIRVSVGNDEALDLFETALAQTLKSAKGA